MKSSLFRKVAGAALAAGTMFALTACGNAAGAVDEYTADAPVVAETEGAEGDWTWNRDRDYFVIGYLPNNEDHPHFATAQDGLNDAMTELLGGMEVREMRVSDPTAMIEAIRLGHIDMGLVGARPTVDAYDRAGALPIVTMIRPGASLRSYTFVRADSDIYTLADLEGRTMAFVDAVSTTSTMLPTLAIIDALPELNLDVETLHSPGQFFDGISHVDSHPNVVRAVIMGDADAGGVASPQIATVLEEQGLPADYLRVIHASDEQIGATMIVSADLDPALTAAIQSMLIDFDDSYFFVGMWDAEDGRFFEISIDDFAEVKAIVALLD